LFNICGAFFPDTNSPQTYINPSIVEFILDENGNYIDSILNKADSFNIPEIIQQLNPIDSVGIYFSCGSNDEMFLYPAHAAFKDTLDFMELAYVFYNHNGGHVMPPGFIQGALTFIDSLLFPPGIIQSVSEILTGAQNILHIYPNPTKDILSISCKNGATIEEVVLYNQTGQKVFEGEFTNNPIDVSDLQPGMYIVEVMIENTRIRQKLLVQR